MGFLLFLMKLIGVAGLNVIRTKAKYGVNQDCKAYLKLCCIHHPSYNRDPWVKAFGTIQQSEQHYKYKLSIRFWTLCNESLRMAYLLKNIKGFLVKENKEIARSFQKRFVCAGC